MTDKELHEVMKDWQLNAAQLAKILCVHSNKMSEYLAGVTRIPCALALHIDALQHVPEQQRSKLFVQRLERKAHQELSAP